MEFEGDEEKRLRTLAQRGLDFALVRHFFDGRPTVHAPSERGGEDRVKTTALFEEAALTLIWCWRGETIRVISIRRAHEKEIRAHRQVHGR